MFPETKEPAWTLPALALRQIVQGTVVVTAVAALFWLLYRFHLVFLLLIAAVIISTTLKPIVNWLQQGVVRFCLSPLGRDVKLNSCPKLCIVNGARLALKM